jgi:hypothetical protein
MYPVTSRTGSRRYTYIYIYIYMCVCGCVGCVGCADACRGLDVKQVIFFFPLGRDPLGTFFFPSFCARYLQCIDPGRRTGCVPIHAAPTKFNPVQSNPAQSPYLLALRSDVVAGSFSLAGGSFWGRTKAMSRIPSLIHTHSTYAPHTHTFVHSRTVSQESTESSPPFDQKNSFIPFASSHLSALSSLPFYPTLPFLPLPLLSLLNSHTH